MVRALKAAPSASVVLGAVAMLQRCSYCPVLSFVPAPPRSSAFQVVPVAARPTTDSTRIIPDATAVTSKVNRRSSTTPQRHPRTPHRTLRCMSTSSPLAEGASSLGKTLIRGCVASVLCATSLFAGPDVFRAHYEVASATGLMVRPPAAAALTDEQVRSSVQIVEHSLLPLHYCLFDFVSVVRSINSIVSQV